MYKVFVNDKPIILTSSLKKENSFPVYIFKNIVIDEIIYKLKKEKLKGINLYSSSLEEDWNTFTKKFKIVSAAGGLVLNQKKEILFIYRGKKWDLPKGKIEKGESKEQTAIREVEEECGVNELRIDKFLLTTYHLFYKKGYKIKETHWFLMNTTFKGELIPQLEEGITETSFKNKIDTKNALKTTYASIKLVYDSFLEL